MNGAQIFTSYWLPLYTATWRIFFGFSYHLFRGLNNSCAPPHSWARAKQLHCVPPDWYTTPLHTLLSYSTPEKNCERLTRICLKEPHIQCTRTSGQDYESFKALAEYCAFVSTRGSTVAGFKEDVPFSQQLLICSISCEAFWRSEESGWDGWTRCTVSLGVECLRFCWYKVYLQCTKMFTLLAARRLLWQNRLPQKPFTAVWIVGLLLRRRVGWVLPRAPRILSIEGWRCRCPFQT